MPHASSQVDILSGGVDHPGVWWVGEGLKKGDQFSYKLCHVDYKECTEFEMDFWIEGEIRVGTEDKWLVQVVVYDGNKIVKGNMELGKFAPEPSGGSAEIGPYRSAFKTSIVWLSAFATADIGIPGKGPKEFSKPSWGKIANIGGQQIIPTEIVPITVPAGTYDEVIRVEWKTGGEISKVWVLDDFPFPIKGATFTHVSEGIAPPEYQFELLEYKENVQENPFAGIEATPEDPATIGCPKNYELVSQKKSTTNFRYVLDLKYGPANPANGCEIEWLIDFKNKFDETEFLNQVQYDILVVDDDLTPLRKISEEEGIPFLYSPSGLVRTTIKVKEDPGTAHYVIWIYGLSPKNVVPPGSPDYLQIDIPISSKMPVSIGPALDIPNWIKNNAGWWSGGQIDDSDFVSGIQFLINQGIMKIPVTTPGSGSGSDQIPSWIKNNAGWWSDGLISDQDFVSGIQWLITNGIMKIA